MSDPRRRDEALAAAVVAAGRALEYPDTPGLVSAVTARLRTEAVARSRPPLPGLALWSGRRRLALVALGLLALLGLAFGARLVLGGAEIRVRPDLSPSGPPVGPTALGDPVSLEALRAALPLRLALPAGPPPDHAYPIEFGEAAVLAWDASERYPSLPGTPWGMVLMILPDELEIVFKDVRQPEDATDVRVGEARAFWIHAPHELVLIGEGGAQRFTVEGNVLIWSVGGVTYRLETTLGLAEAVAIAESVG